MKQSNYWTHMYSFDHLISKVEYVYLDLEHNPHSADDGYRGVCMYIPHIDQKGYTQVGICEDGVCYEGDSYPAENDPYNLGGYIVKVTPEIGCKLLEQWGHTMTEVSKMESLLIQHWKTIDHRGGTNRLDCVLCFISDSHYQKLYQPSSQIEETMNELLQRERRKD